MHHPLLVIGLTLLLAICVGYLLFVIVRAKRIHDRSLSKPDPTVFGVAKGATTAGQTVDVWVSGSGGQGGGGGVGHYGGGTGGATTTFSWNTEAARSAQRRKALEDRRRFRIFAPHDEIEDSDYHEWVPIYDEDIMRDALCRENGQNEGTHLWRLWVCNNSECSAEAYVAEEKIEEVIQGWLKDAGKKPSPPPVWPATMTTWTGSPALTITGAEKASE